MWLERHLNASGRWRALWVDIETAREQPDPARAMRTILDSFDHALTHGQPAWARRPSSLFDALLVDPSRALLEYLARLSALDPSPLVVLIDEADGLVGEAMVSFLTQLRDSYIGRSRASCPASVVLVGQRQVRDYVLAAEDRRAVTWLGTGSPFNINAEAPTLGPFLEAEVWKQERHAVEVKLRRDTETESEALDQVARYLDSAGLGEGWLVMFDLRKELSWPDKLYMREVAHLGKKLHLVGC